MHQRREAGLLDTGVGKVARSPLDFRRGVFASLCSGKRVRRSVSLNSLHTALLLGALSNYIPIRASETLNPACILISSRGTSDTEAALLLFGGTIMTSSLTRCSFNRGTASAGRTVYYRASGACRQALECVQDVRYGLANRLSRTSVCGALVNQRDFEYNHSLCSCRQVGDGLQAFRRD